MEQKNRLLNFNNAVIYQNDDWFKFSLDSVLLVNFVSIRLSDKKIMDLCSGNAPIPMLLTYKTKAKIYGVELQKDIYELGLKSIIENKMNFQIDFINDDIKNVKNLFSSDSFDLVLCNPPYFKIDDGSYLTDNEIKRIARHEVMLELEDIFRSTKYLLRNGGTFVMVHRPDRFVEIIDLMREYRIEPKRVQFVYPKVNSDSNMLLIEGIKNGKSGIKVLKPFIIHNEDGSYKEEVVRMFSE